jgi:hypothetical protein
MQVVGEKVPISHVSPSRSHRGERPAGFELTDHHKLRTDHLQGHSRSIAVSSSFAQREIGDLFRATGKSRSNLYRSTSPLPRMLYSRSQERQKVCMFQFPGASLVILPALELYVVVLFIKGLLHEIRHLRTESRL